MNYFNGHRFRSRATIIVGDPIEITEEMLNKYKSGNEEKKAAIGELKDTIELSLRTIIVQLCGGETSYDLLWIGRQLYTPKDLQLSLTDKAQLTVNFSRALRHVDEYPELQATKKELCGYREILNTFGFRDEMVRDDWHTFSYRKRLSEFIGTLIYLLVISVLALPGGVLMLIPGALCTGLAHWQAKKALANSAVKIKGRDVMLTAKMAFALVIFPISCLLYAYLWHEARVIMGNPELNFNQFLTYVMCLPFLMYAGVRFSGIYIYIYIII